MENNEIVQSGAEEESHASALTQSNESNSKPPEIAYPSNKESQPGSSFGNQQTLKLSLVSFCNLTTLEVSRCHKLENLVTPSIANSMVQLKRMSITDCKKMQEIIAGEGKEVEDIVYFELKSLRLQSLPSFSSFCSRKNYSFTLLSLAEVIVKECPKLEIFSHGKTVTLELGKVCETGGDKGYWTGDLNTTIKMLYAEKREALEEFESALEFR